MTTVVPWENFNLDGGVFKDLRLEGGFDGGFGKGRGEGKDPENWKSGRAVASVATVDRWLD